MEAANNELAGAEAGDGRDESNRSLQERLADAQNAQVGAAGGPARFMLIIKSCFGALQFRPAVPVTLGWLAGLQRSLA